MLAPYLENSGQNLQRKTKGPNLENAVTYRVFEAQETDGCCRLSYMDIKYVSSKY